MTRGCHVWGCTSHSDRLETRDRVLADICIDANVLQHRLVCLTGPKFMTHSMCLKLDHISKVMWSPASLDLSGEKGRILPYKVCRYILERLIEEQQEDNGYISDVTSVPVSMIRRPSPELAALTILMIASHC